MDESKREAAHGWDRGKFIQEEDRMSSPILPPQAPTAAGPISTGPARPTTRSAPAAGPAPSEPSVELDTFPASPPAEVLDQMGAAAQTYEELSAEGRDIGLARDASGRPQFEIRDRRSGEVLRSLSPSEALDIAAGKPLD
jgi:hypothetical protein